MDGGYGLTLEAIAEMTDAEIADLVAHHVGKPNEPGGDKSFLEGGSGTTAILELTANENETERTPEEQADDFVQIAAQLGLSALQAREIAGKRLKEYHSGSDSR